MTSKKRVKRGDKPNIPNDVIITNVVSRLTAKDVSRCRCVCKSWKDMTTTHSFKELHMRRAFPLILVHNIRDRYRINPFLLSKWWGLSHVKKAKIQRLTNYPIDDMPSEVDGFSQDGLIVFKESRDAFWSPSKEVIIYNPTFGEQVKVIVPRTVINSDIYAVFFNPRLKEYCTIWRMYSLSSRPATYKMLNLGSKPCWRELKNQWSHNKTMVRGTFPIYANDSIYWVVNDDTTNGLSKYIMVFEIRTEKFAIIPCPRSFRDTIRLLNIDGHPCLVQIFILYQNSNRVIGIQIRRLKKNEENRPVWTTTKYLALGDEEVSFGPSDRLEPIAVVDGILAFHNQTRIFLCNLKLAASRNENIEFGTITKYGRKKYYSRNVVFWPHITSLVSLSNCPPVISYTAERRRTNE